jgi:hypothetical protein
LGCKCADVSGERGGETGENIDIKLWHIDEEINDIEPFGAIEVKKIGGIDERAKKNLPIEIKRYGNVILTDNKILQFYQNGDAKMYNGFQLIIQNK